MSRSKAFAPDPRYDGVRPINIYVLRLLFVLIFAFVGTDTWMTILNHTGEWDHVRAVAFCMWASYSALSFLGIIHPLRMLPLMLFVIGYKTLWLAVVALPLWRAGTLAASPANEMAHVFIWVWVPALAVPWGYVWRTYVVPRKTAPSSLLPA